MLVACKAGRAAGTGCAVRHPPGGTGGKGCARGWLALGGARTSPPRVSVHCPGIAGARPGTPLALPTLYTAPAGPEVTPATWWLRPVDTRASIVGRDRVNCCCSRLSANMMRCSCATRIETRGAPVGPEGCSRNASRMPGGQEAMPVGPGAAFEARLARWKTFRNCDICGTHATPTLPAAVAHDSTDIHQPASSSAPA